MCFTQWVLFPTNIWNYLFTVQVSSVGSMFDGRFEFINIKILNIILIIFFSQSGLLYPWCSSLLTRNLYIWNKDLAQSDWSTNLTWHYLGWPKSSLFFFKTCQFLYLVKTFSAGFLLSEKLLDCNRFSSFFSLWFTLHLKIPKCASHSG